MWHVNFTQWMSLFPSLALHPVLKDTDYFEWRR
jgi:hypothetical protein